MGYRMQTIYVKRNFVLITLTMFLMTTILFLIDQYFYGSDQTHYNDLIGQSEMVKNGKNLFVMKSIEKEDHFNEFYYYSKNVTVDKRLEKIKGNEGFMRIEKCPYTVVLILCEVNEYLGIKKREENNSYSSKNSHRNKPTVAKDFSRQINQTLVLLKSIALQTRFTNEGDGNNNCISVIILSEKRAHFDKIQAKIHTQWSHEFRRTINMSFVPVSYPKGSEWMKKMFRPCATLRLFIPELLSEDLDSVLYVDTDFIFLQPIQSLYVKYWERKSHNITGTGTGEQFNGKSKKLKGNDKAIAAMAPCLFHYGTKANVIPYYGSSGLNAGLMLMNLTRMRESLWRNKIRMVTSMFQREIKLADQDILNIYFHFYPEELIPISCDWNFRPFQCREGSYCEDPNLAGGISALHGNALSFTLSGPEPLFYQVFQAFHQLNLDSEFKLEMFVEQLETRLIHAEGTVHSDCQKFGGFSVIVLNRMDKLLRGLERAENARKDYSGVVKSAEAIYNDLELLE